MAELDEGEMQAEIERNSAFFNQFG
jgi:hypothetical protein